MIRPVTIYLTAMFVLAIPCIALTGVIHVEATDMTPIKPLSNPTPSLFQTRYISGFGSGDSFTLFFEDRSVPFPYPIKFISTSTGPTGFPESATSTNIKDTHFCVKDWPINIGDENYAYRAWGALENTPVHNFYVSNDLENWLLSSTFTIPNYEDFHSGHIYYGFHDVICLNGTYYAWGECNIGHTLICHSVNGANDWEAFTRVGGIGSGPLQLPEPGTPTGCFFELGGDRGYGKIMVRGNDSAFYLAVNTAAKPSLPAEQLEAAFINPDNWTWHDGSTGLPTTPILTKTSEHDLREFWMVPNSSTDWIVLYDADYGIAYGGEALGYAILSAPLAIEVDIDIGPDTLDLGSKGRWITCYIDPPNGYEATDIDVDSILLEDLFEVQHSDVQNCVLMVKFDQQDVIAYIELVLETVPPEQVLLTVTGELTDKAVFKGSDTIRLVKDKAKK